MEIRGHITLGLGYTNPTQQVRKISEAWIAANAYCLKCDSDILTPTSANTKSRDFVCENCLHAYELKSKCGLFSTRVLDGAYGTMVRTIREGNTPTFLLLEYARSWSISGLRAVHHSLITETSVEARKPLAPSARRAGWIGCNIILPAIAIEGQIAIAKDGVMQPKSITRDAFAHLENLSSLPYRDRSWAGTILNLLHRLPSRNFALADVYKFDSELQKIFPENKHVRPKIRQQLQVYQQNKIAEAEPWIRAAWRNGNSAEPGYHLAVILEKNNHLNDALAQLELAAVGGRGTDAAAVDKLIAARRSDLLKAGAIPPTQDAKLTLQKDRTYTVPRGKLTPSGQGSATVEFFVSSRGTTDMQIVQGDQSLLPLATPIALLQLDLQLPPETHAKLVRRGILSCHTEATCQLILVPTTDAVANP